MVGAFRAADRRSCGDSGFLQRRIERVVEEAVNAPSSIALLQKNLLRDRNCLLVTGPSGHALEQLIGGGEPGWAGAHHDDVLVLASGDQCGHSINGSN